MNTINLKKLAADARAGKLTSADISDLVANVEATLKDARKAHVVGKRNPKKVAAAAKKAAATRKRNARRSAKWAAEIAKRTKAEAAKRAAGYLPEFVNECGAGYPNPAYYVYAYTDERSGGYEIFRLRPEYAGKPVPNAAIWIPIEKKSSSWF